jgi:hypothetical protein
MPEPVEDALDRPPGATLALDQRHILADALTRKCLGDTTADANLELSSPFSLASDPADRSFLEGYLTSDLQGPALFRVDVVGSGTAIATFDKEPGGGQLFFRDVTYSFLTAETVPEPTSLLLLATGLIAAGFREWRSRARR